MSATKTKKGLSLLLAIIMLFSMMPTTIFTLGASDNLPVMMATATSGDFHAYKGQVVTVTFLDYIDEVEYAACSPYAWDISASSATGTVKAWMKVNSAETEAAGETRYDVYMKETLPILDYFKGEGKVVVVQGQSEPEQSYQNMIDAFKSSNIAGLKEFIEG